MGRWDIPEKGMILNSIKIQDLVNKMQTGVIYAMFLEITGR